MEQTIKNKGSYITLVKAEDRVELETLIIQGDEALEAIEIMRKHCANRYPNEVFPIVDVESVLQSDYEKVFPVYGEFYSYTHLNRMLYQDPETRVKGVATRIREKHVPFTTVFWVDTYTFLQKEEIVDKDIVCAIIGRFFKTIISENQLDWILENIKDYIEGDPDEFKRLFGTKKRMNHYIKSVKKMNAQIRDFAKEYKHVDLVNHGELKSNKTKELLIAYNEYKACSFVENIEQQIEIEEFYHSLAIEWLPTSHPKDYTRNEAVEFYESNENELWLSYYCDYNVYCEDGSIVEIHIIELIEKYLNIAYRINNDFSYEKGMDIYEFDKFYEDSRHNDKVKLDHLPV